MSWEIFSDLQFSERISVKLVLLFLKYFAEIFREVIWAWGFLCERITNSKFNTFNFFNRYKAIRLFTFWVSSGSLSLQRIYSFNLSCLIYWKISFTIFPYYNFNIFRLFSSVSNFIPGVVNLCLLSYFFDQCG